MRPAWPGIAPRVRPQATFLGAISHALCTALAKRGGDTVVVSDEVGLGVHPSTEAGNRFRDALGLLNQQIAVCADDVFLVVAGRTLSLS